MGAEPGFVVWLTGKPASGKTTLAQHLAAALRARGTRRVEVLDGDEIRSWLAPELGFSRADRDANVRRTARVAALLARNEVAVIVALVSPYESTRQEVRRLIGRFVLVHVDCPSDILRGRDPKGLYRKALAGELEGLTGVSDPYEEPHSPDVRIRTDQIEPDDAAVGLLTHLEQIGYIRMRR